MKNNRIKNDRVCLKSQLIFFGIFLFILIPALAISQPASDPWMEEMEKAKGLSVGDLEPRFGDLPSTPGADSSTGTGSEDGTTTGTEQTGDMEDTERAGPVKPDTLDPNDPEVASYIKQWTSSARPPQNAVPGSNWRYDQFGRVVGSGPGLRTTSTHDSVDYGGGTPEATVWSLRKELDSIDHCTLEEYVVAQLEQKSISHCAGRYGAVKDLKGIKLSHAKSAVTGAGFKYTLAPGSPASTPQDEGTIERQEPGPNQYLKNGQTLKLTVYSPHVPGKLTLPDFIGQSLKESKKWLKKNKLEISLQPGSPAPSKQESGTIEAQEPAPKTVMQAGGTVMLKVHSNYVKTSGVPKVVGLSVKKAKKDLLNASLGVTLKPGGKPADREQAGTVERQSPEAGSSIPPGSEVSIFIYGPYVDTTVIPDVRNLFYNDAKNRIEAAGLTMSKQDAGQPSNRNLSDKAYRQDPPSGAQVSRGQTVQVWFYRQYNPSKEEQVASFNCSGYPGSKPYWDDNAGQPKCGCFDGLRWNLANSACVSQEDFAREWCAANRPGSISVREADGGYECKCPNGYVWTADKKRCVKQVQQKRKIYVHDITGSYEKGKIKVTRENNKFVGRLYGNWLNSEQNRKKGYYNGIKTFEVSTQPDVKETIQGKKTGLANYYTAYPGIRLTLVNNQVAYTNCHVWVGFGFPEYIFGRLQLSISSGGTPVHDSRMEKDARIGVIEVDQ